MDLDPFDYSDGGIALRTLARMYADAGARDVALDMMWRETRDRALFLFHRVVCRIDAATVERRLVALEAAFAGGAGDRAIGDTRDDMIETMVAALLAALGFEPKIGRVWTHRPAGGSAAASPALLPYETVVADMRASRFAGTGRGGVVLSPLEDAIRRLTAILTAGGFLTPAVNGGAAVAIGTSFGLAQLRATRAYVDACLTA